MTMHGEVNGGRDPDFGAIFMSNKNTMGECFERKLLGLPYSSADFVKRVRPGMILFLFEYEKRKLHGVFQAISDGTIDIVPYAYRSSGKYFPAQVRFSVVWNCRPLFEDEFRDAIRDNYYTPNKFNFGLSKDQVYRLLLLFNGRKVRVQRSVGETKVKEMNQESSDEVNPLVECGKLGLENEEPIVKNLCRLSSIVVCSRDPAFQSEIPNQSVPLRKKEEHTDTSSSASSGLGDFIPLSTSEDSDPTEIRDSFEEAEDLENNQTISPLSYCLEDSYFSEADIVASHFGYRSLNHPSVAYYSNRGPCDGNYQSNPVHQHNNHPWVKGLYSDTPKQRSSVFSRLNLVSEVAAPENEDTFNVKNEETFRVENEDIIKVENEDTFKVERSVHEIMKNLQHSHDNWKKTRKAKYSSNEGNAQNKRGSVFSRLNFASEGAVQKVNESMNEIKENLGGKKKSRGREVFIRNNNNGKSLSVTVQVEIGDVTRAENHSKDTWRWGRMEEQIPLLSLKRKGEMLNRECISMEKDCKNGKGVCLFEEQLEKRKLVRYGNSSDVQTKVCDSCLNVQTQSQGSSAGKGSGQNFEISTRNESIDDNENGLSKKDLLPSKIYPIICEVNNEGEGKGLIGEDARLQGQVGPENTCLPVAITRLLRTYQRRHGLSTSPCIKDPDKEVTVGEENAECHLTSICT